VSREAAEALFEALESQLISTGQLPNGRQKRYRLRQPVREYDVLCSDRVVMHRSSVSEAVCCPHVYRDSVTTLNHTRTQKNCPSFPGFSQGLCSGYERGVENDRGLNVSWWVVERTYYTGIHLRKLEASVSVVCIMILKKKTSLWIDREKRSFSICNKRGG
jgi:hypothetical protein